MRYEVVKHDKIVPDDATSPDNWVPSLDDPEVLESKSCIADPFIMYHQRYMKNGILDVMLLFNRSQYLAKRRLIKVEKCSPPFSVKTVDCLSTE